jgi:hypothetical protein
MFFGGLSVKYHDRDLSSVNYEAYGPQWLETDGGDILPGRNFTEQENNSAAMVAILNDTLAKQMFGQSDPIGKTVLLNSQSFQVIGVYQTTAGVPEDAGRARSQSAQGHRPARVGATPPRRERPVDHADRQAARPDQS